MARQPQITLPRGTQVPNHVAMILDGNRRWARAHGLKPWEGHAAGYKAIREVARASRNLGVHTFTAWAFSTENWERSQAEVSEIMNIFRMALKEGEKELHKERVRLIHLGRKDRLPEDVRAYMQKLEDETRKYGDHHIFNLAVDYGGRDEIVRAVNKILISEVKSVDIKSFASYLDTADQPYPNVDLFIRTSGEQRTSGLLPWQMDYAEFYFEYDHLPEFNGEKLKEAILDFSRRRRRFGGNDAMEHMKFDPKVVAGLELKWRHELAIGEGEKFSDLVLRYVTEQYGLSKDLARDAASHLVSALKYRQTQDWEKAKTSLSGLYEIVKRSVGLAMEPEIVAQFEVKLWRQTNEEDMRTFLAEKYRFSNFQASKSAHLAYLADVEMGKHNWKQAKSYLEKFYEALKERVA